MLLAFIIQSLSIIHPLNNNKKHIAQSAMNLMSIKMNTFQDTFKKTGIAKNSTKTMLQLGNLDIKYIRQRSNS